MEYRINNQLLKQSIIMNYNLYMMFKSFDSIGVCIDENIQFRSMDRISIDMVNHVINKICNEQNVKISGFNENFIDKIYSWIYEVIDFERFDDENEYVKAVILALETMIDDAKKKVDKEQMFAKVFEILKIKIEEYV